MIPAEQVLRQYSEKVYKVLYPLFESTFSELQRLCQIGNTDLCFALMLLIRENKIKPKAKNGRIYYLIHSV